MNGSRATSRPRSAATIQLAPSISTAGRTPGTAADAITGINKYTFRSGRQTYQDVKTAATFLKGIGKNVTVFAQDSVFGNGNFSAVNLVIGASLRTHFDALPIAIALMRHPQLTVHMLGGRIRATRPPS